MAVPVAIAGLALGVYGTIQQSQAIASSNYANAQIAEQNATLARDAAAAEARRHKLQTQGMLAHIRGQYAAGGVSLEGSPMDVLANSAANAELDNMLITYGGELKGRGLQDTASMDRSSARNATSAGYYNAAANALLGGSNVYTSNMRRTASYDTGV